MKKEQKRKSRGITLVALVVTIIVLLILAGVTITSLLGDEGIISKAQQAANATKKSQVIENIQLDILLAQLEGSLTKEKLEEILDNYGEIHDTLSTIKFHTPILARPKELIANTAISSF